jgi:hypothetical protein
LRALRLLTNILSATIVIAILAWGNAAHANSACLDLVNILAVEAAAQKSEADATVKFIAKGLRPFATPEQMAKMAGDLKTTADLAKARCTVEATSANGDK